LPGDDEDYEVIKDDFQGKLFW